MHGVKKVAYTIDEKELRARERRKKLEWFQQATAEVQAFRQRLRTDGELGTSGEDELLNVTEELLSGNPDIYTLWNLRRKVILRRQSVQDDSLEKLYARELRLTVNCLMTANPKSYGAWFHRRWILSRMETPDFDAEIKLCNKALKEDERNFHCWDHRRFVCHLAGITAEKELQFADEKVADNFSNYSNWHYRSVLLPRVHPSKDSEESGLSIEFSKFKEELEKVQNAFFTDPEDSSSWFYRQWLLGSTNKDTELKIMGFNVFSDGLIYLLFNQPILFDSNVACCEIVGEKVENWTSASGKRWDRVWFGYARHVKSPCDKACIRISLRNLSSGDAAPHELKSEPVFPVFHVQQAKDRFLRDSLESDVENCRELLELEPNLKWPLLTLVGSLTKLDSVGNKEEIITLLKKLAEVDPKRKRYYGDMKDSFLIRSKLNECGELTEESCLDLANLGLKRISDVSYFAHVKCLNLEGNDLTDLTPLASCVGLVELNCSNNLLLADKSAIEKLPRLLKTNFSGCGGAC